MRYILFIVLNFLSCTVFAALDEVIISNEDKTCAIHYLTTKTKFNWTIKVDTKNCKNGWVDGYASVQLYSPRKEQMETLTGFFNEGYWTDTFPATGQVIERTSPEERTQSLSFLLGKDEEANITYIGQLRAVQPEARPYSAFQGCPDLRILIVVQKREIFQNIAFQDRIVQQGLKWAHQYCSAPDILALFGATTPTQPEIIFQMQVDTITGDRTIISPVSTQKNNEENKPSEIREEKADVLLSVEPQEENASVSYTPSLVAHSPKTPETTKEKEILSHLQILSKIKGTPVKGRIAVHIHKVSLDNTAITDLPEKIELLYHPNMKEGWAVVEGVLNEGKMQVSSIQSCQQEWCTDVP